MNTRISLLLALCGAVLSAAPAGADVVANFTDGNDDATYVDAFHGIAGDGWATPWEENLNAAATLTTQVVSPGDSGYSELYAGGGRYLSTVSTPDADETDIRYGLGRDHGGDGGIPLGTPYHIEFTYRIDEDLTAGDWTGAFFGNDQADRYQMADGAAGNQLPASKAGWQIIGYASADSPNCPEGLEMEWSFVDGLGSGSLAPEMAVNTDIAMVSGGVYHFSIDSYVEVKRWSCSVEYLNPEAGYTGATQATQTNMGFRGTPVGSYVYFSSRASNEQDARAFSVDGISISALPFAGPTNDLQTFAARFDGGGSDVAPVTDVVDAYTGMAGAGWQGPWRYGATSSAVSSVGVLSPGDAGFDEIKPGETGAYLKVEVDHNGGASYGGVTRNYKTYTPFDSGIDWSEDHTIEFTIRIDEDQTSLDNLFTEQNDRYQIGDCGHTRYNVDAASRWMVACYGGEGSFVNAEDVGVWVFYDGQGDAASMDAALNVESTINVVAGGVYDFTITVDPDTQTYVGSVTDGVNTFTTGELGWRGTSTEIGGHLVFSTRSSDDQDVRAFSLDEIVITQLAQSDVPGDANGDGFVDETDAAALATYWGVATGASREMGDFNGDGAVNVADAAILAANWNPNPGEATAVPEPTVAVLLIMALTILATRRARQ
jgi:hypothetical protein